MASSKNGCGSPRTPPTWASTTTTSPPAQSSGTIACANCGASDLRKKLRTTRSCPACTPTTQDGAALRLVGTVQDITERKRVERKLRILTERLDEEVQDRTARLEGRNLQLRARAAELTQAEQAQWREASEGAPGAGRREPGGGRCPGPRRGLRPGGAGREREGGIVRAVFRTREDRVPRWRNAIGSPAWPRGAGSLDGPSSGDVLVAFGQFDPPVLRHPRRERLGSRRAGARMRKRGLSASERQWPAAIAPHVQTRSAVQPPTPCFGQMREERPR